MFCVEVFMYYNVCSCPCVSFITMNQTIFVTVLIGVDTVVTQLNSYGVEIYTIYKLALHKTPSVQSLLEDCPKH